MSVELYGYLLLEEDLKLSAHAIKELIDYQEEIYISFGRPNDRGWELWHRICENKIEVNVDKKLINQDWFFIKIDKELIKDMADYIGEISGTAQMVFLFAWILHIKGYCLIRLSH